MRFARSVGKRRGRDGRYRVMHVTG